MSPYVGLVTVDHTDLWLAPAQGARMVICPPADGQSRERLERPHAIAMAAEAVPEAEEAGAA